MVVRYSAGVAKVGDIRRTWAGLGGYVDPERYSEVAAFLSVQEKEARWWRDACLAYFRPSPNVPCPQGMRRPSIR